MTEPVRLNLGAGQTVIDGFTPVEIADGKPAYPLPYADNSVDEIRASHILEHFPHGQSVHVVQDWARALKPGGTLRLAVPDFDQIIAGYLRGSDWPIEGFLMGGQKDRYDCHYSIWNRDKLTAALEAAGLVNIREWTSELKDCAALPCSLNLAGDKPTAAAPKPTTGTFHVEAVMSMPRLAFTDNYMATFRALASRKINLRMHTGAFWGQCLTKAIKEALADGADAVLTLDYDTVFTGAEVDVLVDLMQRNPEVDAIAALQSARCWDAPLMTIKGADGKNVSSLPADTFRPELTRVNTAHFGLTLLRGSMLRALPEPWFMGQPNPKTGQWDEARVDDDIYFWRKLEAAGRTACIANRAVIGHLEHMVMWPGRDFHKIYQHASDFWKTGRPGETWQ